jgi:drug/metabolite transporter (DMT)-like permease
MADTATWPSPDGVAPSLSATGARHRVQPAVLVVIAVSLFALSDVLAKVLSPTVPGLQLAWIRYLMIFGLAGALAVGGRTTTGALQLESASPLIQILRGLAQLGAVTLFILGLAHLEVGEATSVSFVTPVLVTLLSIPILGEVVRLRRWSALGLSLIGVVLVVRPDGGAFHPGIALPLGSAACGAIAVIVTRKLGAVDASRVTLFWSASVGLVALSLTAPLWMTAMTWREIGLGAVMGGVYALGQYLLIQAYARGEASLLAPFSYAQVVIATVLAVAVFGVWPGMVAIVGVGLIALSGVYTLLRERTVFRWRSLGWPAPR